MARHQDEALKVQTRTHPIEPGVAPLGPAGNKRICNPHQSTATAGAELIALRMPNEQFRTRNEFI